MNLEQRIEAMTYLGTYILDEPDELKGAILKTCSENPWFDYESYYSGTCAIARTFLNKEKLINWINHYNISETQSQKIGMVLAGNIPLVGFHDVLCVFISGHHAQIKLSERDKNVLPLFVKIMASRFLEIDNRIEFVDRLSGYDAVIATGSDNSKLHFEYYFKSYPKILRGNRNGVAVLSGEESNESLQLLSDDIFMYYGLGCRNISKIYIPKGYDFESLVIAMNDHKEKANHHKYRNNFDYNLAIYTLNQVLHINTGFLLIKEDNSLHSRIATLHFEYYDSINQIEKDLLEIKDQIQCVVTESDCPNLETIPIGQTQNPQLHDYADGVDVMAWLIGLDKHISIGGQC